MFDVIDQKIYFRVANTFDSNIGLIIEDGHIVLVDSGTGMNHNQLVRDLKTLNLDVSDITDILLTHSHIDHIGGILPIMDETDVTIHLHKAEAEKINAGNTSCTLSQNFGHDFPPITIESILDEGSVLEFGDTRLKIYHTPGHSLGSVCIKVEDTPILFTGDTMFPGGSFGRVDFPGGDKRKIVESLKRISSMDFDIALPGHMNAVKSNGKKSAISSYQMAKSWFKV
ncbi:MAG: putative polyketide biosynthesis zinc-dependent hydrolase PksB [Candidatus Thorarchaeota archaeon]|nr:MAG: putative polyketide biosynthesis zinc-dependent hydrolase PksB [Candidatus Thorarchaeota archaeon]